MITKNFVVKFAVKITTLLTVLSVEKKALGGLHSPSKNDDKKFCSSSCMNKHYDKQTKQQASDFWAKYKGWIIGGGIVLVVLIILGVVLGGSKKKRRY